MKNNSKKNVIGTKETMQLGNKLIKKVSQKQKSVRTTFTLTKEGDAALTWAVEKFKSKIKSIVDMLCSELQDSLENDKGYNLTTMIIEYVKESDNTSMREIRKTMVLSEKSLLILNDIAKKNQISRDAILDRGIYLIVNTLKDASVLKLAKHETAKAIIDALYDEAVKKENSLIKLLDEDDPIRVRFGFIMVLFENLSMAIYDELKQELPSIQKQCRDGSYTYLQEGVYMKKTYHSEMRMQQRGVTNSVLDIVLNNGQQDEAPGGAVKYFFGKKEYQQEMNRIKECERLLERAKNTIVIVRDGIIITTYKNQRPNMFM